MPCVAIPPEGRKKVYLLAGVSTYSPHFRWPLWHLEMGEEGMDQSWRLAGPFFNLFSMSTVATSQWCRGNVAQNKSPMALSVLLSRLILYISWNTWCFFSSELSDLILVGYSVASTYQGGGGGKCEAKVGLIGVFFSIFHICVPDILPR